jgi:cell division protein FtsB
MAVEIALVLMFLSLLGICVSVLVWDIKRRRVGAEGEAQTIADLQLRVAELEEQNRQLKNQVSFLDKLGKKAH